MGLFENKEDHVSLSDEYVQFLKSFSVSKEEINELKKGIYDYTRSMHEDFVSVTKQLTSKEPTESQRIRADSDKSSDQKMIDLMFLVEKNTKDMVNGLFLLNHNLGIVGGEQKGFSDHPDERKKNRYYEPDIVESLKAAAYNMSRIAARPVQSTIQNTGSILGELMGLLSLGSLAAVLGPLFVGPFLKWFDENFGTNLKQTLDKVMAPFKGLESTVEHIGKWAFLMITHPMEAIKTLMEAVTALGKVMWGAVEMAGKVAGAGVKAVGAGVKAIGSIGAKKTAEIEAKAAAEASTRIAADVAAAEAKVGSKVIGEVTAKVGGGMFSKLVGGAFKKLPIVGFLISAGIGIKKLYDGDITSGVLNFLSAGAGLLDFVVPGLGLGLSLLIDVFDAKLDIESNGDASKKSGLISKVFTDLKNTIWDSILSFFNYVSDTVKGWLGIKVSKSPEKPKILEENAKNLSSSPEVSKSSSPVLEKSPSTLAVPLDYTNPVLDKKMQYDKQEQKTFEYQNQQTTSILKEYMDEMMKVFKEFSVPPTVISNVSNSKPAPAGPIPTQRDGVKDSRNDYYSRQSYLYRSGF
jgi:hypothetical protein